MMKIIDKLKTSPKTSSTSISLYDIQINSIEGKAIDLGEFEGRKILFVNVASKCGFTPQYKELQKLYDTYQDSLMIIACPCNQFGKQEPGDATEIQSFCERNYGVTFLVTEKIYVKGSNKHELYDWLTNKKKNGKKNSSVKWNFQKYLVDEKGALINYYYSITNPASTKIIKHLES